MEEREKRRALKKGEREMIFMSQKGRCNMCRKYLHENVYDIDHIHPLWDGGSNEFNNLQAICLQCHGIKSRITEPQMKNEMKSWSPSYRYCWKCKYIYSMFFKHQCNSSPSPLL